MNHDRTPDCVSEVYFHDQMTALESIIDGQSSVTSCSKKSQSFHANFMNHNDFLSAN